jgi:hypothetical protein
MRPVDKKYDATQTDFISSLHQAILSAEGKKEHKNVSSTQTEARSADSHLTSELLGRCKLMQLI